MEKKINAQICKVYRTYIDRIPETSGYQAWKTVINLIPSYLTTIYLEISKQPLPQFNNWIKEFSAILNDKKQNQFKEIERMLKMIKPMGSRIRLYPQDNIKAHI